MNEFLVVFLIVSFCAFNSFCMNPSTFDLPFPDPPKDIQFGDCFVVAEIVNEALNTAFYSYYHICPEKVLNDGHERPEDDKLWFLVGQFKGSETLAQEQDLPLFHYLPSKQSLITFEFLKENKVKLLFTILNLRVTFQSLEQSQAFYKMIHDDAIMSEAAPNKIGVLHEIELRKCRKIGNSLDALHEKISDTGYITFKNEGGEPLLIFPEKKAKILIVTKPWQGNMLQVLLQVDVTHYILTFSKHSEAEKFSQALLKYLKPLHMGHVFHYVRDRFKNNEITCGSEP